MHNAGAAPRRAAIVLRRRVAAVVLAASVAAAPPAFALDLIEAWQGAQRFDMEFAAMRAGHEAGGTRRAQSAALWRPTVTFTGTLGRGASETASTGAQFSAPGFGQSNGVAFNTSINSGNALRWGLQARQPLISGERQAQRRQLELGAEAADHEWQGAQQALMLRTAERYFDTLLAAASLRVLQRQQQAVQQASAEAKDRFALGDAPVTDTYEAGARVEGIKAQVLAAQAQLQLSQAALVDITGLPPEAAQTVAIAVADDAASAAGAPLPALPGWIDLAKTNNPQLRMQSVAITVARQQAERFRAGASASVDLVAQMARDRLNGGGDFGAASNRQNNALIGIEVVVPLYTGGYREARQLEALRLVEKAEAEAGRATQQVTQQVRAAWLGLSVGAGRVAALADALKATRSRLDATRVGREVGDRTTLDLLNAENDAAAAELALLQGRVMLLLDRLRLAALAGQLDEAQLHAVNAMLRQAGKPD